MKTSDARLNALYQRQRNWMENYFDDRHAAAFATTWRPGKGAELRFDGELGYRHTANRVNAFTDAAWRAAVADTSNTNRTAPPATSPPTRTSSPTPSTAARSTATSTPKGTNALTKSGAAVWFPFEKFGFYANYSEGFKPPTLSFPNLTGNAPVNILRTDNYNVGLRFTFLENKLVGSVGHYRSNEQDRPQVQCLTTINAIWDNIPGSEWNRVLGGAYSSYIDFIDTRFDGGETDITANLTRGLRLKFNASISDGETVSGIPGANAYYEKHLPTWRAALANPAITQARRNTIQTNLPAFENDLVTFGTNGRRMNATCR